MGGKKNSKEDVNVSSAESVQSSEAEEEDYSVERVLDKRMKQGKVCIYPMATIV